MYGVSTSEDGILSAWGDSGGGELTLYSATADLIRFTGHSGADILKIYATIPSGKSGSVFIEDDGGANDFTVEVSGGNEDGVSIRLERPQNDGLVYPSYEPTTVNLRATAFGRIADNSVEGWDGADTIIARVRTEWADDSCIATNNLSGGLGDDVIRAYATVSGVGSYANNYLDGGAGNDRLFAQVKIASGATAADAHSELYGGAGNDRLTVKGGEGNILNGGAGDDTLIGGSGSDTLIGLQGDDALQGKGGADIFLFGFIRSGERDRIADFTIGEDVIDLSQIDANRDRAGEQSFRFGTREGTGRAWIEEDPDSTGSILFADDGHRVLEVLLKDGRAVGADDYSAGDFLL